MSENPPEASTEAKVDKIGAFPAQYDTDALPERRNASFARMAIIIATVEAFVIAAQGFALAAVLPLQKVVPMVVTSNPKGDELIHINPITLDSPTADYVAEISLRNYVQKRYSIVASSAEQQINWGLNSPVQLMSTPEAYESFMRIAREDYNRLRASNMVRTVRIDSVRKIGEDTWQVEFVTTDQAEQSPFNADPNLQTGQGSSQGWVTTFSIGFSPQNVAYSARLNNPFGMVVQEANDARRD